mgnify:CR=1 FL=1
MGENINTLIFWKSVDDIKEFPKCDDGEVTIKLKEYNQILIKNERLARHVFELQTEIQEIAVENNNRVLVIVKDEDDEIKGIDLCKFDDVKKEVEERIEENIEEMNKRLDELSKEVVKLMEENAVLKYDIAQFRERGLWQRILNK